MYNSSKFTLYEKTKPILWAQNAKENNERKLFVIQLNTVKLKQNNNRIENRIEFIGHIFDHFQLKRKK